MCLTWTCLCKIIVRSIISDDEKHFVTGMSDFIKCTNVTIELISCLDL